MFGQHGGFVDPQQAQQQPQGQQGGQPQQQGGANPGAGTGSMPGGLTLQQMIAMGAGGMGMNAMSGGQGMTMGMAGMQSQALQQQQQQQQQQQFQGSSHPQPGAQDASGMSATMANMSANLMYNPQLQALLQQQMLQQQQPNQQPQQQAGQQGIRWPNVAPGQQFNMQQQMLMNQAAMGQAPGQRQQPQQQQQQQQAGMGAGQMGSAGAGGVGQGFNPFLQQQQQQQHQQQQRQQQQQQQQQSYPQQGGMAMPNFLPPNFLSALQAQQQLAQQQAGGQQGLGQGQGITAQQLQSINIDPAALIAAAAQASGGMMDPNTLLQNAGLLANLPNFGAGQGAAGGNHVNNVGGMLNGSMAQQAGSVLQSAAGGGPGPMQAAPQTAQQSPKQGQATPHVSTPESKSKARPRTNTRKKKDAEQLQRPGSAAQPQQAATVALSNFAQPAPSPAPSMFQTPTQSHTNVPMPSPAQAFTQQQERARSHTRSPSVSGAPPHSAGNAQPRPGSGAMPGGPATQNGQSGWAPSLTPVQQQQLLGQALSFSKARSGPNAQSGGPSPAQVLMQMGYIYVKANVLPNNGFGAGIPGNGPSGAGAVLSIDDAKAIGIFGLLGQQGQQPGQAPMSAQDQQSQMMQQQQQRPPMKGMPAQQPPSAQLMQQSHMAMGQGQQAMHPGGMMPQQMQPHISMPPHGMPGSGPHTPQHSIAGAIPPGLQHAGYRASPLGLAGSPAPGSLPPSSPAPGSMAVSSPAMKANMRHRQASISSRPASSAGQASTEAQMAAASYAPYEAGHPAAAHPGPLRLGAPYGPPGSAGPFNVPHDAMGSAGGVQAPFAGMQNQSLGLPMAVNNANLPPVQGGPLPKKTKLGFDVAPEYNIRLTPLPSSDVLSPGGKHRPLAEMWKPMSEEEEAKLVKIMRRDDEYTKLINSHAGQAQTELMRRFEQMRPIGRLHWWERGADEDQSYLSNSGATASFKVLLPADKRTQRAAQGIRSAFSSSMTSRQIRLDRDTAAHFDEDLVPVRLEIDHENWRLRDTFTWPAPESYKSDLLERFALTICDDFGLPAMHFVQAIRETIMSQVQDHVSAEALRPPKRKREEVMGKGRITPGEARWWKKWREDVEARCGGFNAIQEITDPDLGSDDDGRGTNSVVIGGTAARQADLRIQIKLDITVGAMNLVDQFEWDVNDDGNSAEDFATAFAADLGLSGEFKTAIAHSIREQVDVYTRSLALIGYSFDGGDVLDEELRGALLTPVSSIVRTEHDVDAHTPKLMQLSESEILQLEKEREREARRKRRQTRGRRGVNLPDREPLKTARTPAVHGLQVYSNAGPDGLNAAGADSSFGVGGRGATHDAVGTSTRGTAGMSTRRAAAVIANANIAHSSASAFGDFGTPTPQPEDMSRHGDQKKEMIKRRRLECQATHFEYPGGLGKIDDEIDDEHDVGPRFAVYHGDDSASRTEPRGTELGSLSSLGAARAARQALGSGAAAAGHGTSSPSTPVAWNMARPEEALNQVQNWHDGMWYCSNCGVPGNMDPTRRKGPLGDKTLCGMCGKYFHRHRKARPVDYTRSVLHHLKQLQARGITPNMADVESMLNKERGGGDAGEATAAAAAQAEDTTIASVVRDAEGNHSSTVPSSELGLTGDSIMAPSSLSESIRPTAPDVSMVDVAAEDAAEPKGQAAKEVAEPPLLPPALAQAVLEPSSLENPAMSQPHQTTSTTSTPPPPVPIPQKEAKAVASFPTTRGNSPELPFEQVGSPEDSDSSSENDEDVDREGSRSASSPHKATSQPPAPHKLSAASAVPARSVSPFKVAMSTPMAYSASSGPGMAQSSPAPSSTAAPGAMGASSPAAAATPPDWLTTASVTLRVRYSLDRFEIIPRPRPAGAPSGPTSEWRVRCQDCPGKLYTPGPGETLDNFEIHLRNRVHRGNVAKAAQQDGRKPFAGL